MKFQWLSLFLLLLATALVSSITPPEARGDVYMGVGDGGVAHFTDSPPDPGYKLIIVDPKPPAEAPPAGLGLPGRGEFSSLFLERPVIPALPLEGTLGTLEGIIVEAAARYMVDPHLIRAVIKAESDFNHLAVSPKGALGLMQLMPETIRENGVNDPFSPRDNVEGGVRHLAYLLNAFQGDLVLALAAYNAGVEAVVKYRDIPPFKETREYVRRVVRYLRLYRRGDRD